MKRCIENLQIWQISRDLVNHIYEITAISNDYGFKNQIQRAAISIMNNIAEGHDSGSDSRFIYYLNVSRGSCSEVNSMLYLCEDFKLCSPEKRAELQNEIRKISAGCLKMINSMKG